ncbi:GIY-YIG nuclease family protein [candidate division WS5 bacterium]|uniref:GIY-YIG nuclease family protein n=1 Tax=candidate division WS5 bacterium TaxID=2093353 RepID=A0A419DFF9_9BACT|nr:MAG: GIY-YIG nuclease family protein [candidate division WS5 bacterium]
MRKEYNFYVYIIASDSGTLYTGITNDLERRNHEHKNNLIEGFCKKYKCHKLIYFEETNNVEEAIKREKQIKNWNRKKKENLIKIKNPTWRDLSDDF